MAVIGGKEDYKKWTHKALVKRMSTWLRLSAGYTVVFTELSTVTGEIPDVIGWGTGSCSTLIECKASREDFLKDADKSFRRYEHTGVGEHRYYATPKGVLNPKELPDGWGLLEVGKHQVRQVKAPEHKTANKTNECIMLISALRRLEISTAVFVRQNELRDTRKAKEEQ